MGGSGRISAQFTQSSILGSVRDASGSALPNAEVTVRNEGTNISRSIVTDENGDAFNRANFNNPNTNIQSGAFGLVTTAGAGRSMLFGLRLDF
jgi:hypothetical protein